jgi:hypothetical protein
MSLGHEWTRSFCRGDLTGKMPAQLKAWLTQNMVYKDGDAPFADILRTTLVPQLLCTFMDCPQDLFMITCTGDNVNDRGQSQHYMLHHQFKPYSTCLDDPCQRGCRELRNLADPEFGGCPPSCLSMQYIE